MTPPVRRFATWTAVAAVLAAVFALYARPEVAVMLAEQLWACFGQ
jgi:hypothetical protein